MTDNSPITEDFGPVPQPPCPAADDYGICVCCGFRVGVACICDMTFAERAHTVGIDREALRRFHGT